MANALKGEIEISVEGNAYTLCFTTNAIAEVEQLLGDSVGGIAANIAKVEHQRALLWGALQRHHKGIDLLKAGALMDEFDGGLEPLVEALARALRFRLSRTPIDASLSDEAEA
tara:strand:+ start:432 stop:770 length:339 start_codon:yes stop_codon:yes gene_type:complete